MIRARAVVRPLSTTLIHSSAVLALLAAPPARADLDAGLAALDRRDYVTAVRTLVEATNTGDPRAAAMLADIHERGLGVPRDYEQSLRWRQLAAEQGDAESAFRIGNRFARGDGVRRDEMAARDWYRKAATRGHPAAQLELSKLLGAAGATDADARESATWFERAKANGAAVAPAVAPPPIEIARTGPTLTDLRNARRERERAARASRPPVIGPFVTWSVPIRSGPAGSVVWLSTTPGSGGWIGPPLLPGVGAYWVDPFWSAWGDPRWPTRDGLPPGRW